MYKTQRKILTSNIFICPWQLGSKELTIFCACTDDHTIYLTLAIDFMLSKCRLSFIFFHSFALFPIPSTQTHQLQFSY